MIALSFFCVYIITTGKEWQSTAFCSERNIPRIQISMNHYPGSTSTARFSTILNRARKRRSPMQTMRYPIPSTDLTLRFRVRKGGNFIDLNDFLYAGSRKSLFTIFGPAAVSIELITVDMAFDEKATDPQIGLVPLHTSDATSYGPSSCCTLMASGLFGSGARNCSLT